MNWGTRCACVANIAIAVNGLVIGRTTAHAAPFNREIKLFASNPAENEYFGVSVGISDNTAIVGAHFDDDAGANVGSAHVFDATTGNQLFKLVASDARWHDNFGNSVAISDNIAIVGSYQNSGTGSAYVFDVKTGDQLFKLTGSDAGRDDLFGNSVAISGKTAIVGSVLHDPTRREDAGAAYLFDVTSGEQLFKLTPSDIAQDDLFGYSVSISGNTAIVGAPQHFLDTGYAYLYDVTSGSQLFKLTASDGAKYDNFGTAVAISGKFAIVGSPGNDRGGDAAGAAYLFDITTGAQLRRLTSLDIDTDDQFGNSVSISGNLAIVGASRDDDLGGSSGSAYVFDVTTGEQLAKLIASDGSASDEFGRSVAISGTRTIVGAWQKHQFHSGAGSAYLFVPEPSVWLLGASGGILCGRRWRRR